MQFISGDFWGKGVKFKDLYVSFRCTNHTHPSCVKYIIPIQHTYLPTSTYNSLKQSLNKAIRQH